MAVVERDGERTLEKKEAIHTTACDGEAALRNKAKRKRDWGGGGGGGEGGRRGGRGCLGPTHLQNPIGKFMCKLWSWYAAPMFWREQPSVRQNLDCWRQ